MDFPVPREGYGIVCGAVYFCVDDVLDKFDGVVGDSVNLRTRQDRNVLYSVGNGSVKNPQRMRYLRTASHGVGILDSVTEPVALWRSTVNNYSFNSKMNAPKNETKGKKIN